VEKSFKGKLRVAQHDWMNANPGKVMSLLYLTLLKYAVNQASFIAKNLIAGFAKKGKWEF